MRSFRTKQSRNSHFPQILKPDEQTVNVKIRSNPLDNKRMNKNSFKKSSPTKTGWLQISDSHQTAWTMCQNDNVITGMSSIHNGIRKTIIN